MGCRMFSQKCVFLLIVISCFAPLLALAEDDAHNRESYGFNQEIRFSPELKQLLIEEMVAIQEGMMALIPAISSGDWRAIVEIGTKLHDSYIMKQKLSKSQIEEFHHSLPTAFQELDHSFHHSAGMLAHAAETKNADVVNFYFFKLTETCVSCHSRFATHRFPGFVSDGEHDEHHH